MLSIAPPTGSPSVSSDQRFQLAKIERSRRIAESLPVYVWTFNIKYFVSILRFLQPLSESFRLTDYKFTLPDLQNDLRSDLTCRFKSSKSTARNT